MNPKVNKIQKLKIKTITSLLVLGTIASACDKSQRSFSLLGEQDTFQQAGNTFTQRKIDILWVIDNSGSMQTSQANLVSNFSSFINRFQTLGFDYHMAVTTTDAYLADPYFNNSYSTYMPNNGKFKDGFTGTYGYGKTGIFVMTPANTTATVFQKNISMGASGAGDERAFSSMIQALNDPQNASLGFRRADAFLSVIILSDEDDFSGTATNADHFYPGSAQNYVGDKNYNAPNPLLRPISYYVGLLDAYAGGHDNYSVSSLYTDSTACKNTLDGVYPGSRIIAQRMPALSDATKGQKGSLCGDFGATLNMVTNSVISLASIFKLDRLPQVPTIRVTVNGMSINQDVNNGWTYDAVSNSVAFHGASIPAQGAVISITYDPVAPKN